MDIVLTDEQRLLRESAAEFVERHAGPKAHRAVREGGAGFDRARLGLAAEAGWLSLVVPEDLGGMGLGATELALVCEAGGRGLMTEPVAAIAACARAIVASGNRALAGRLLPDLMAAKTVVVPVLPEAAGGEGAPPFKVVPAGDGLRLEGAVGGVVPASVDGFLVPAAHPQGLVLVHVPRDSAGMALTVRRTVDGGGRALLRARAAAVPDTHVVAGPNSAPAALAALRQTLAVGMAAEMLGVMEAALDMALAYIKTRVQFGRPVGSFQALQHRAVNDHMEVELTRALLYQVCAAIDGRRATEAMAAALMARASEAVISVTRSVIQMHGAIGFTDEYDAGLYLRRAMALSVAYGNAGSHRARFGALAEAGSGG